MRLHHQAIAATMILSALFYSGSAKADIAYTFIKMSCDPQHHVAKFQMIEKANKEGEAYSKHHPANIYYLDDLNKMFHEGKKIDCQIDAEHTVSFTAVAGSLPKYDDFELYANGTQINQHALGYGTWKTQVTYKGQQYIERYCPNWPDGNYVSTDKLYEAGKYCYIVKRKLGENPVTTQVLRQDNPPHHGQ